jgi:hypothetical protein
MKVKRIIQAALIVLGLSIPCYAIKSMMFNSIDQYTAVSECRGRCGRSRLCGSDFCGHRRLLCKGGCFPRNAGEQGMSLRKWGARAPRR